MIEELRIENDERGTAGTGLEFGTRCLCLEVPRDVLYDRINRRVEAMIAAGWIDESRQLRALGRPLGREARQAAGYAELFDHIDGKLSLADTVARIQLRTRNLAKRQLTWFRSLPECLPATEELTFSAWGLTMDNKL